MLECINEADAIVDREKNYTINYEKVFLLKNLFLLFGKIELHWKDGARNRLSAI